MELGFYCWALLPLRGEARQAQYQEYVWALSDDLHFTQSAHAVVVLKQAGKVWHNVRIRSSGRCECAGITPQVDWRRPCKKVDIIALGRQTIFVPAGAHAHLGWVSGPRASQKCEDWCLRVII
ncbi:hypothetical protein CORMATOL_00778 [Corynebacterium matruchotii ATCC 33806]|uniref:Uncharacterized protein n=1 Tax=Corynebacterium matruchotii ATCC 33806 TaxID=566549 RepID=C0E1C7_9CORY|nr:hypothetical protein CORMATOL_00778 [Corynebacterium matruchotii ATCC 33806]